MTLRLCATMIVWERDADQTERMLASCEKIGTTDYVIAVDRKSPADTVDRIQTRLGKKAKVFWFTWRDDFSYARNLTIAKIPKVTDWFYWVDWDDEIVSTIDVPQYLAALPDVIGNVMCWYDYGRDEHKNRTIKHTRSRFLRWRERVTWTWQNDWHEDIHSDPIQKWVVINNIDDIRWVHRTNEREGADAIARNLRIGKLALQKNPKEPRTWYNLGNAYFSDKQMGEAVRCWEQYVSMSGWDDERWVALVYCAIAYRDQRLLKSALNADLRAMELRPEWPDHYLGLAYTHANMNDWERAKYWAEQALERIHKGTLPPPYLFVNEKSYRYDPYALLASVYFNLGDNERALKAYDAAISVVPDPRLIKEREHLAAGIRRLESVEKGIQLAAHLAAINEPLKAKAVLDVLPAGSDDQFPEVNQARMALASRIPMNEDDLRTTRMREEREPLDLTPSVDAQWLALHLKAKRVLMLGVHAATVIHVARQGVGVVGTDIDPSRVQEANRAMMKIGLVKSMKIEGGKVPLITRSSTVQFHWCPPDDLDYRVTLSDGSKHAVKDLGPFDAVVIGDLHTAIDPEKVLAQAEAVSDRIFLLTPDGNYDGPQKTDRSTLRVWSQMELGRYLFPRGQVWDLHTLLGDTGDRGTIVAQYKAGAQMETEGVKNAVIWCFDTHQKWSPDNLWRGGIGGSETAAIHMGRQLTSAGYRVIVFGEAEGVWDGVLYQNVKNFRPFPCKVFISWRTLGVLPQMAEFADHRFLWMHDTDIGAFSHKEKLAGVTIIALSDWQIGHLSEVYPGASIIKSGNGIVPSRFDGEEKREPYRLIWASSPDRGLEPILKEWPKIREEFPKATLHVYYGFDMVRGLRPAFMARLDKQLDQPGITVHGRVDQDTLAREYMKSDVLVYQSVLPNNSLFHETYCIMAVEAQAAGCVPITHSHGALAETNHTGIQTDDVWSALRRFWKMPKAERDQLRENGKAWARQQTWEKVRDGWLKVIEDNDRLREQGSVPSLEAGAESLGEGAESGDGSGDLARPPQFARGSEPES